MDTNFFLEINTQAMLAILMLAITIIQVHNQAGKHIKGRIFTKHTATNTASAIVSNLAPNALMDLVFLAIVPSTMSVTAQNKYVM